MITTSPLRADPSAVCTGTTEDEGGETDLCGKPSRFVVERSDGDTSFGAGGGTEEACETHLADAVLGMADGDASVTAIVTIRWDAASRHTASRVNRRQPDD